MKTSKSPVASFPGIVVQRHVRYAIAAPEGNVRTGWRMMHIHLRQRRAVSEIPQADETRLRQVIAHHQIAEIANRRVIGRQPLPEFTIAGKPERNGVFVARKVARLAAVQRGHGGIGHVPQRSAERKRLRRTALVQRPRRQVQCPVKLLAMRIFHGREID